MTQQDELYKNSFIRIIDKHQHMNYFIQHYISLEC